MLKPRTKPLKPTQKHTVTTKSFIALEVLWQDSNVHNMVNVHDKEPGNPNLRNERDNHAGVWNCNSPI